MVKVFFGKLPTDLKNNQKFIEMKKANLCLTNVRDIWAFWQQFNENEKHQTSGQTPFICKFVYSSITKKLGQLFWCLFYFICILETNIWSEHINNRLGQIRLKQQSKNRNSNNYKHWSIIIPAMLRLNKKYF
jgi:hypothetical protein